jgi:hypothetical protein
VREKDALRILITPIPKYAREETVMKKNEEKHISTLKGLGKALSTCDLELDLIPSSSCTEATLCHVGHMALTGRRVACIHVPTNGADVISSRYVRNMVEPIRDKILNNGR